MRSKGPKKPPLTHFLCIPLITPVSRPLLETSLKQFKTDFIAARPTDVYSKGGDTAAAWLRAVRPLGSLHLTLGVMSLQDKGRVDDASKLLRELDFEKLLTEREPRNETQETQTEGDPTLAPAVTNDKAGALTISLKALHPMQSPKSTSVLYAEPHDATDRLKPFGERLRAIFMEKGLVIDDDRPLQLHATIVNTVYSKLDKRPAARAANSRATDNPTAAKPAAKGGTNNDDGDMDSAGEHDEDDGSGGGKDESTSAEMGESKRYEQQQQQRARWRGKSGPVKIDARDFIKRYADFDWAANVVLDRIAICEMGAKKKIDDAGLVVDEAYTEVAVASLSTGS